MAAGRGRPTLEALYLPLQCIQATSGGLCRVGRSDEQFFGENSARVLLRAGDDGTNCAIYLLDDR